MKTQKNVITVSNTENEPNKVQAIMSRLNFWRKDLGYDIKYLRYDFVENSWNGMEYTQVKLSGVCVDKFMNDFDSFQKSL